ncbi:MAG: cytochrome c [Thermodesulfobacteriota bacterium]
MKIGYKVIQLIFVFLIALSFIYPSPTLGDEKKSDEEDELHEKGEALFQSKGCIACHTIGKGKLTGPDLKGVTVRRDQEWLARWLKDPDSMILTDPTAKELLKEFLVPMPNQGLTDEDIKALMAYLKHEDSDDNNEGDRD